MDVAMPRLSDSMEEGLIVTWLVDPGAEVARGDEIVEIETDKATMTYEADADGLVQIVANEGDSLPVGALIARILGPGEDPSKQEGPAEAKPPAGSDPGGAEGALLSPSGPPPAAVAPSGRGRRPKASPLARRIAAARSVDLSEIEGSGPGGRIVRVDVERAARTPNGAGPVAPGRDVPERPSLERPSPEIVEPSRLQVTVARRMAESKATIPHFYLSTEVDMTRCHEARVRLRDGAPDGAPVPSFNDMVVKASALALREFPKANASFREERFELHPEVNVGVAVAAEDALVVPVVAAADRAGLAEISARVRELARKVRDGSVTPADLSGGTFTVSNLGMFGVTSFDAVINPGQAAILAVGAIVDRPVVREGAVVPGKVMGLTLSCDHRILYGAEGAEFLARIKSLLEEPLGLAL